MISVCVTLYLLFPQGRSWLLVDLFCIAVGIWFMYITTQTEDGRLGLVGSGPGAIIEASGT